MKYRYYLTGNVRFNCGFPNIPLMHHVDEHPAMCPRVIPWAKTEHHGSPEVQAVCADFLNFFLNNLESGAVLGVERGVPVNTEVRSTVAGSVDAVAAKVMEYVAFVEENCAAPGAAAPSNSAEVYSVLVDLYMSVAFGVTTPADAAEQFVSQANNILAANA